MLVNTIILTLVVHLHPRHSLLSACWSGYKTLDILHWRLLGCLDCCSCRDEIFSPSISESPKDIWKTWNEVGLALDIFRRIASFPFASLLEWKCCKKIEFVSEFMLNKLETGPRRYDPNLWFFQASPFCVGARNFLTSNFLKSLLYRVSRKHLSTTSRSELEKAPTLEVFRSSFGHFRRSSAVV